MVPTQNGNLYFGLYSKQINFQLGLVNSMSFKILIKISEITIFIS